MRKALYLAAVWMIVPTLACAESRTLQSGVKTQIATHSRFDRECRPTPVEIKVVAAPKNGTVTSEPKDMVVPAQNNRGEKQPPKCVGKAIQALAVFYQSNAGFTGEDSVRYLRFNPRDAKDRFNAEFTYTITVK
jgi:hypothetical protein